MVVAAGALAVLACATAESSGPLVGDWGGEHLGLVATVQGADLEYDCATGHMNGPLAPGDDGRFSVTGVHHPGHGGPIRQDEETVSLPARYDGELHGFRLKLRVTLTDTNELLGSFDLIQGASPHVFKCL